MQGVGRYNSGQTGIFGRVKMKTFNKANLIRRNERLRRSAENGILDNEDRKRKKKMCSTCNFLIDNRCSKNRLTRRCAEQGLKNKE